MAVVSNSGLRGDFGSPPLDIGHVTRGEVEPALRLILSDRRALGGDDALLNFLAFSNQRGIDVASMWVARLGERVVWALLPVVSPGKTALLLSPNHLRKETPPAAVGAVAEAVCREQAALGTQLAQLLLDPDETGTAALYAGAGFEHLAELIYLSRSVRRGIAPPKLPPGVQLLTYSAERHALFAETIVSTYAASLDCPGLNGRRDIEDVITGHRATGIFDPGLWFVLTENGRGVGVLLLNQPVTGRSLELVYLGLAKAARGRGFGDLLMQWALSMVSMRALGDLTLAVDAANQPALKLYYRHGMKRVTMRVAMVKQLNGARL